jgi:hypothetical protein
MGFVLPFHIVIRSSSSVQVICFMLLHEAPPADVCRLHCCACKRPLPETVTEKELSFYRLTYYAARCHRFDTLAEYVGRMDAMVRAQEVRMHVSATMASMLFGITSATQRTLLQRINDVYGDSIAYVLYQSQSSIAALDSCAHVVLQWGTCPNVAVPSAVTLLTRAREHWAPRQWQQLLMSYGAHDTRHRLLQVHVSAARIDARQWWRWHGRRGRRLWMRIAGL